MTVTREAVLAALATVVDPRSGRDVVQAGVISGLVVRDGHVGFAVEVDPREGAAMEPLRARCERAAEGVPGVLSVSAVLTAHTARPEHQGGHDHGHGHGAQAKPALPGIRSVIAVASGKGGVGKSTTAVNLALALARRGLAVGLLDADIYGPSVPRLMGLSGKPDTRDGKKLLPMRAHGVACMSIGFLIEEDTPMIWRGPMVISALTQLLNEVEWGALDVLVCDLPPGTGDVQLTMAQRVPVTGAVIVSTPQDIALIDARKGLNMFRRVEVPVFGIVENMSTFICPHCGERSDIFGHGGARDTALKYDVDFLGEIPLSLPVRIQSDLGMPIVAADPDGPVTQAYLALADSVATRIETALGPQGRRPPRIVVR
ncbi:iron-sulfur cluster carrier protein ApbC [Zavarzinia sp. CC-PAN008]|uniref:iron-sulfur cluster carrier protein ApbC n=1 Tax=Zavarzinia sp. CC-PAN008 TaxID=3243332 RepID=UPI003F7426A1